MEGVSQILQEVVTYFSNHFRELVFYCPMLDRVFFYALSKEDCVDLTTSSLIEIDQDVVLCDGNKNHDTNDFNFSFFIRF